jgi:16S rRNA (cytosine967-C5)-methyltransferase
LEILKPLQKHIISQIIDNYNGDMPFYLYFNQLVKKNKNWGSKDRKIYRHFAFQYFRLGHFVKQFENTSTVIEFLSQDDYEEKIDKNQIFPFPNLLSEKLNHLSWSKGMLQQRPIYLAVNKKYRNKLLAFLIDSNIEYAELNEIMFQLPFDTSCQIIIDNGWAWMMDVASQKLIDHVEIKEYDSVWDCCSGAGGKSLFLKNKFNFKWSLTCSDIRTNIINNLKQRFQVLGFSMPHVLQKDLTIELLGNNLFDVIIADVPCSGSGTWGRNPENLINFKVESIETYVNLQKKIVTHALHSLKLGGELYYMTCSVFEKENELNRDFFINQLGLELMEDAYSFLNDTDSDYLYMAKFKKTKI